MNNKIFSDKVRTVIRATSRTDKPTAVESAVKPRYVNAHRIINFLAVIVTATVSPVAWAAGHAGRGGVVGGGHIGGFAGGVSHAAPAFYGRGLQTTPAFQGAYFTGRSPWGLSRAPQFYYGGAGMPPTTSRGAKVLSNRATRIAAGTPAIRPQDRAKLRTRQSTGVASQTVMTNRTGSLGGRNQVSATRPSTAVNRPSFVKNHASERHDANNWHRDWDRHHAHFHNNRVFVFINGFWWGLYPWDYYPYYAYGYPYGYDSSSPYDYYNGYPDSYYDSSYPPDYDGQSSYFDSQQSVANAMVSTAQMELAKLGYYHGAIDGVVGDETQAALARYQEDHDLSVTGTLTAATLQSLKQLRRDS